MVLAADIPGHFARLYERYADAVYRYCYRHLGTVEAAEDATSLIFLKALAAVPRYHSTSFRAWLFTIARHVIADQYRAIHPNQPLELALDVSDDMPSPEDVVLAADEERSVRDVLFRLPEHQRQVVALRLAGLTGPEISSVLGRSSRNVNVTQWRAVERLRALLAVSREAGETTDGQ